MKKKLYAHKLHQLCRLYGIQTSYVDGLNLHRQATPDALISVLNSLGAGITTSSDLSKAVTQRLQTLWNRMVELVSVAWDGHLSPLRLNLPQQLTGCRIDCLLTLDSGETTEWSVDLSELPIENQRTVNDSYYTVKKLPVNSSLPYGYHTFNLRIGSSSLTQFVISAPVEAYSDDRNTKNWGLFCPAYAVHSQRSCGGGDLTDFRSLQKWGREQGAEVTATLPLLASLLEEPFEPSPYSPASRLMWNEFYVDPTMAPEFKTTPLARKITASYAYQESIAELRSSSKVDYKEQMVLNKAILEAMAEQLFAVPSVRRDLFEQFLHANPEVHEYARFRAVGSQEQTSWSQWSDRLKSGSISSNDFNLKDEQYHLYVQWLAHEQLEAIHHGDGQLYLDLPLGANYDSYDVWKYEEQFVLDVSAGAPPDALFVDGQNWGFPPQHPEKLRLNRYRYYIDYIRHHFKFADMMRVDHVMGLHRLYWVPSGVSAKEGVYVHYLADEMYAILCLESHRSKTSIVGEDLGTVPQYVRKAMDRHKFQRMYVMQFELTGDPKQALNRVPANTIASINTHDTPTFSGFWHGKDIDDLVDLGLFDEEKAEIERDNREKLKQALIDYLRTNDYLPSAVSDEHSVLKACLGYLGESDTQTVLVNLEDLWLEQSPQNVPGTYRERPNWLRKTELSLEDIRQNYLVTDSLKLLKQYRNKEEKELPKKKTTNSNRVISEKIRAKSLLTKNDLYLFNEGTHYNLYNHLGAHPMSYKKQDGTYFAVWAPDAEYVSVIGNFNDWNRTSHPIYPKGESGIWEGFIPGIQHGELYKYFVKSRYNSYSVEKGDPFATFSEIAPKTASIVWNLDYEWNDQDWMTNRSSRNSSDAPMSVYELHLGSWKRVLEEGNRSLSYREMTDQLIDYILETGFTHVELMPVMEHPFFGSWGYQITGFFSPSSRYGTPQDFMYLVDKLHQNDIGVILDWVPSHFPADDYALGKFDGTNLYEHADPRKGIHPDWDSLLFNYGRKEVVSFLISNAMFWLDKYHADGLRVDGVASMLHLDYSRKEGEWIPNEHGGRENLEAIDFLRKLNEAVYQNYPDVQTIAEESTSFPMVSRPTYLGGLGFGMKWDMGWMHDTLEYMQQDPIFRKFHHNSLTFRQLYAHSENFMLPLSHDEVVHMKGSLIGKMPGDVWQKFANLRLLLGYMYGQTGKKLLFMGAEFGQLGEWNHDGSLDWSLLDFPNHSGMLKWVSHLNKKYRCLPELHGNDFDQSGFEWIDCNDTEFSVISFIRKATSTDTTVIAIYNFTPQPRYNYRVGCPVGGAWTEELNSDGVEYGGSGIGNYGAVTADQIECHGRPYSLNLTLPPLSAIFFRSSE